jgi:phage gp16-like protein
MNRPVIDEQRKRELGLIHMAKAHLQLSQADYEHVLREVTGKTSAADLDAAGRDKLLRHFKAKGFKVRTKAGGMSWGDPQRRKLRAMWYMLAEAGAVDRPANGTACDAAIEAWAKRQINGTPLGPLDALRFANGEQLGKLIEEMKRWGQRVKADIA